MTEASTIARKDIHAEVTATIVAQLEKGVRPWAACWEQGGSIAMPKRANGEHYSGVNILLLWMAAGENGFKNSRWMTFKQAQEMGANVRKGSKGTKIVYASTFKKEVEVEGKTEEQEIPYMKGYTVFNCEQIDGLPESFYALPSASEHHHERIASADAFLLNTGVPVQHEGGKAFYAPSRDVVVMPKIGRFEDREGYYATLAHEMIHATGHKDRLDRLYGKRFGDDAYAVEELVAEMGAAFVMAELGLSASPREDHASYLAGWLRVLKADKRAIFTAASAASKAAAFLRDMVAAHTPKAPEPTPPAPRRARKVRETVQPAKGWTKGFRSMGAARYAAKAEGVQGVALQLREFEGEGWGWRRYEGEAEEVTAVVVPMPAPKAPKVEPVPSELAKPVRVIRKRARVGDYVVTWADGSTTRVTGVVHSKEGDEAAAAYQAADRLRRMRASHTMGGGIGEAMQEVRRMFAAPSPFIVIGACGIRQLSPAFWQAVRAYPMAAPVMIVREGGASVWGEAERLAA